MPNFKQFSFLLFLVLGAATVKGQAVRSPFTTFGIGEPYGNSLIQNQGMGGMGVSQPQYLFLNNQNPALLIYNSVTVFQAGLVGESRTIRADTLKEKNTGGNLNYLVTAFPVISDKPFRTAKTKWTTSLGLMPFSTVKYDVQYQDYSITPDGQVVDTLDVTESGSGGLTQFYWSNGIRLSPHLSFGIKAAYLFGPLQTSYSNTKAGSPYLVSVKEKTSIKDFLFTFGMAYSDTLGTRKRYGFHVGGTYSLPANLSTTRRVEISRFAGNSIQPVESDTLLTRGGSMEIPGSLTVGFSFFRINKWTIGTEFNYQDWRNFRSLVADDEGLTESWRGAVGGEFTPDPFALENYLKRVTYRVGLAYEQYPFIVNGNQVKDFGINFGFSLPAGRSSLDMAFKVGKRADRAQNILEESYFKVYFGITFNDQWFIKRKFD